ncbi:MAG: glycosyltransferase family A protein [Leeuwenhoekiella sp.]
MKGISIIIPTFNREKYIANAIDSVLLQDYYGNLEILVSDDGSTDKTIEIVRKYGNKVRILMKPKDCKTQGASGARNRGLKECKNDYISFLDSDDFFLPDHLNKMVKALESESNLGFSFCRILEMKEKKNGEMFRLWTKKEITPRDIKYLILSKHNVIQTNGFLIKREVFDNVGYFDENLKNGEDVDMWMRISELYEGAFSDSYGAVIRKHGSGQLTDTTKSSLFHGHCTIFKNALKRCKKLSLPIDRFRYLKLNYIVYKYQVMGIPEINKINSILRGQMKDGNSEIWYKLDHFLIDEDLKNKSLHKFTSYGRD